MPACQRCELPVAQALDGFCGGIDGAEPHVLARRCRAGLGECIHGTKSHQVASCPHQTGLGVALLQPGHLLFSFGARPARVHRLVQHHIGCLTHGLEHAFVALDGGGGGPVPRNRQEMQLAIRAMGALGSARGNQCLGGEIAGIRGPRFQ